MSDQPAGYVLGHGDAELTRLEMQARVVDPITREYLEKGGLRPGMRVLDLGSGAGHTAFIAADIVGRDGEVVGADKSAKALAMATAGAKALGFSNLSFIEGDPAELDLGAPFDAMIGRYVLIFQSEPARWLLRLKHNVIPGGPIIFHEPDLSMASSSPPVPAYDRACRWMVEAFGATQIFRRLRGIFISAGLPAPTMRMQLMIGGVPDIIPWLQVAAEMAASLSPAIERLGLGTATDVEVLRREMLEIGDSTIIGRAEIGAWSRIPYE